MIKNNLEVRLLIKGRPAQEFYHNGQFYLEGREGSNFEVEIINHNPFRVEAIVSVDGLSIIDGKDAGEQSSGYLVEANQTISVPGWKIDDKEAAKFEFAGKKAAYATQMTGSSQNTGVIGIMAFKEAVPQFEPSLPKSFRSYAAPHGGGMIKGMATGPLASYSGAMLNNVSTVTCSAAAAPVDLAYTTLGASHVETQNLGTAFGAATEWQTTTVQFTRGDLLVKAVIYYDNIRGLKARGIRIERTGPSRYRAAPQAFPGSADEGCTPPPGWGG